MSLVGIALKYWLQLANIHVKSFTTEKVRYTDTTTTISAPLGSAIKLDCSTTQPLHVNTSHTSEQQCYQDNGSGVIDIQRLSSVDAGDHVCVVNNGLTDVVKVIHVEATG